MCSASSDFFFFFLLYLMNSSFNLQNKVKRQFKEVGCQPVVNLRATWLSVLVFTACLFILIWPDCTRADPTDSLYPCNILIWCWCWKCLYVKSFGENCILNCFLIPFLFYFVSTSHISCLLIDLSNMSQPLVQIWSLLAPINKTMKLMQPRCT